jgi:hypothetical protein
VDREANRTIERALADGVSFLPPVKLQVVDELSGQDQRKDMLVHNGIHCLNLSPAIGKTLEIGEATNRRFC